MRNFFILFSLVGVIILAGVGCGAVKKRGADIKLNNQNDNRRGGMESFASSTMFGDRVKASFGDLTVGKKIMVLGKADSDGTITASQILIGDFANFVLGTPRGAASGTWSNGVTNQRQRGGGITGAVGGGNGQGGSARVNPDRMMGQGRVVGEILKKDEGSLVVKMGDGGSKIIFYSGKTEIFIVAPSPAAPVSATSTK